MTPLEALDMAVARCDLDVFRRRPVGAVVLSLPAEAREALAQLTSDEARKLRCDLVRYQRPKATP